VPRLDACDAYRRKESRRRKWRQGIKENKCGSCKWRFRHLASDITQVLILAASDQSGRNFRDVDAENVSAEGGTGDADDHDEPWVEMKQQQQHHQNRPRGWREDGDAIDSQRGDENEDIHPHDRLEATGIYLSATEGNLTEAQNFIKALTLEAKSAQSDQASKKGR